jgi:hypothetical protein
VKEIMFKFEPEVLDSNPLSYEQLKCICEPWKATRELLEMPLTQLQPAQFKYE